MLLFCIEKIHYGLILLFGTFTSAAFSGVPLNKKNILPLSGISFFFIAIQIYFSTTFGVDFTFKIYPLITHLPLILFLTFKYKRHPLSATCAVAIAYLCCQLAKWLGILAFTIVPVRLFLYSIKCVLIIIIGFLLIRYIAPSVSIILSDTPKNVFLFSILPFVYYFFDYTATVYNDWLYSGNQIAYEFLPFILSISYLFFCAVYFREYEKKGEMERRNQLLEIQSQQSAKEISLIYQRQHELVLLRHDMRHYLQNILNYVEIGSTEHAISYIRETIGAVDNTSLHRFCQNELVNTVLSFYQGIMEEKDIQFQAAVNIEPILPCSELDFSSILSNGLENAVKAVRSLPVDERIITLSLKTEQDKLFLSLKNRYSETPVVVDGKPVTNEAGHGFGTESIRYVTEKLNGNCQFSVKDGTFILRVVL